MTNTQGDLVLIVVMVVAFLIFKEMMGPKI